MKPVVADLVTAMDLLAARPTASSSGSSIGHCTPLSEALSSF